MSNAIALYMLFLRFIYLIDKEVLEITEQNYYDTYNTNRTQHNRKQTQSGPRVCSQGPVGPRPDTKQTQSGP